MKKITLSFLFAFGLLGLKAQLNSNSRYQSGYYKTSGVYVSPHYKSISNGTNIDNFSTFGNQNPYTGQMGSRAMDFSPSSSFYGAGQTIYTGPNGGQYYINSNGNKTYVPKR